MPQNSRTGIKFAEWKYQKHRAQSKFRGIDFNFTFDEWMNWWKSHGVDKTLDTKWTPKTRPCMCRYNDTGPYEISNVYFATHDQNVKDIQVHGRFNPRGRKTDLRYRWASEIITLETLQTKYNIVDQYEWPFYNALTYDANRQKECKTLTKQWNKIPTILWWETENACYKTLDDASKFEGIPKHILRDRFMNSTTEYKYKKNPYLNYKKHKVKISLKDYIRKNSRFPDPLFAV